MGMRYLAIILAAFAVACGDGSDTTQPSANAGAGGSGAASGSSSGGSGGSATSGGSGGTSNAGTGGSGGSAGIGGSGGTGATAGASGSAGTSASGGVSGTSGASGSGGQTANWSAQSSGTLPITEIGVAYGRVVTGVDWESSIEVSFLQKPGLSDGCAEFSAGIHHPFDREFHVGASLTSANMTPVDPITSGTFPIGTSTGGDPSYSANGVYIQHDGTCGTTDTGAASGGELVIESIDQNNITGHLNATYNGDDFTITFVVPICSLPTGLTCE